MNVGELKEMLEQVSDDAIIVVSCYDHSYRKARVIKTTAASYPGGDELSEDFGELNPDDDSGYPPEIVEVLFVE